MRIAVDCRWIFPKISGIGKHTDNLVRGLNKVDRKNTYLLLKEPLVPYGIFSIANQIRLPRLLRRLDVHIYHSTNFMIPLFMKRDIKVVITIHDLIPWKFPEYTPRAKKTRLNWLFKLIMKKAVKRADRIIAVSENTARDIKDCFGVSSIVVYNGIDEEFFRDSRVDPVRGRPPAVGGTATTALGRSASNGVDKEGYILFVGRRDPYKNLSGLIKAYEILLQKYNVNNNLLVVGDNDPRYPRPSGLNNKIIFHGYADMKDLADIYRKASVLVMPSLYEGFGYPAIEAMACGLPVVVSNTPALVEIVKDNAAVIDPNDYEGMADAIYRAITNGTANKAYARQFTIDRMARETLKVYESCLDS